MSLSAPTYIYPPLDSNPTDLYNGFTAYMQSQIPGWAPYSGELDDWLGRAFASIAAQLTEITSDVATSIFRYFGAFVVGVPPIDATPATGVVTFTVQDTAGYTIPAFTQVNFADPTGAQQGFETLVDVVIAPGGSTATGVVVSAETQGTASNGCSGSGSLVSSLTFITAVTLTGATGGGADAEDDADYLNRLSRLFVTLTPTPITVDNFTAITLSQPGVGRCLTIGGFNPANAVQNGNTHSSTTVDNLANAAIIPPGALVTGSGIPAGAYVKSVNVGASSLTLSAAASTSLTGTPLTFGGSLLNGGTVGSFVTDASGDPLGSTPMAIIQATIQAMCLAGVNFTVSAPTQTAVSVTTAVVAWPGQDTASIQAAVVAALTEAVSPAFYGSQVQAGQAGATSGNWFNDTTIRVVVLENVCMNVQGVHYVSSLTVNGGGDFGLPGVAALPTPGTITVTVTAG